MQILVITVADDDVMLTQGDIVMIERSLGDAYSTNNHAIITEYNDPLRIFVQTRSS